MIFDGGDRYSVGAILALYAYEPTLRDVFVEGASDRGVLSWYLDAHGLDASVYAIDDRVEVPGDLVRSFELDVNARGRAIAFAIECDRELGVHQRTVTVAVDADFEHVIPSLHALPSCLLMTDQPGLECYVFGRYSFEKFLRAALHMKAEVEAQATAHAVVPALRDIFAVRLALFEEGIRCIDDISSVCHLAPGSSAADVRELVLRSMSSLAKAERPCTVEEMCERIAQYRERVDSVNQIGRGHDIAPLLIRYLKLKGPVANPKALETAMLGSLELDDLDSTAFFSALRARLAAVA